MSLQNKLLNSSIVWSGAGLVANSPPDEVQNFHLERDADAVGASVSLLAAS